MNDVIYTKEVYDKSMLKIKRKTLFILGIAIIIILVTAISSYATTSQTKVDADNIYLSDITYLNDHLLKVDIQ